MHQLAAMVALRSVFAFTLLCAASQLGDAGYSSGVGGYAGGTGSSFSHFKGPVTGPSTPVQGSSTPNLNEYSRGKSGYGGVNIGSYGIQSSFTGGYDGVNSGNSIDYVAYPKYNYAYGVTDGFTGDNHSASESRDGHNVEGTYQLVEPDGNVRTVKYQAGPEGFNAVVQNSNGNGQSSGRAGGAYWNSQTH